MSQTLQYFFVRAALFVVPFAVLVAVEVPLWLALIMSLLFAFAVTLVFFRGLRDRAAAEVHRMREGGRTRGSESDDDAEDSLLDSDPESRLE